MFKKHNWYSITIFSVSIEYITNLNYLFHQINRSMVIFRSGIVCHIWALYRLAPPSSTVQVVKHKKCTYLVQ